MFERKEYKENALRQLDGRKAVPAAATLVSFLILLAASSGDAISLQSGEGSGTLLSIAVIFIHGSVIIAYARLLIQLYCSAEKVTFSSFVSGFSFFLQGVLGLLWYMLWVTLWSFLFFIPGIVKAFSYSQMFFILAENPKISIFKAMNLSKILTRGHKCDLLVMAVSFLGWDILSVLTLGILQLWLIPYKGMSYTNAYFALKQEAFRTGILTPADFSQ